MIIEIEPLGTEILLPAIVIGYEIDFCFEHLPLGDLPDHPPWILSMAQQAGGYGMSYPTCVGLVLRLLANTSHSPADLPFLIQGFQEMAEDPRIGVLKQKYPVLHSMVATWGQNYTPQELTRFSAFLADYLSLPPIEGGIEAFIRFAPCHPLEYFAGWKILSVTIDTRSAPASLYQFESPQTTVYHLDSIPPQGLILADETEVSEGTMSQLLVFGKKLGIETPPRVFLLWENSD
ncbi:MAG TPA: hypothetical protein PLB18_13890 [Acidobacteriota bacterium]|nr:hypothetical protein [Acidobacteriota bacterium]